MKARVGVRFVVCGVSTNFSHALDTGVQGCFAGAVGAELSLSLGRRDRNPPCQER